MSRGKNAAAVNQRLRVQLADALDTALKNERRAEEAERQVVELQAHLDALAAGSDVAAERQRHAAAERRLSDQIEQVHAEYRTMFDDAESMVRKWFEFAHKYADEHDLHEGPHSLTITSNGAAALRAMWSGYPWPSRDARVVRRAGVYRGGELRHLEFGSRAMQNAHAQMRANTTVDLDGPPPAERLAKIAWTKGRLARANEHGAPS